MMVPNKKTKAIFFSNKSNCLRKFQAFLLMERYVKRNILIEFATKLKKPHHRSIWGPSCPKKAKARTLSKQLHQIYSLYVAVTSQKYSEKKLKSPITSCKKSEKFHALIFDLSSFIQLEKPHSRLISFPLWLKNLKSRIFEKKII